MDSFNAKEEKQLRVLQTLVGKLNPGDKEYIELMPWPLEPVYHELDERMTRIKNII